MLVGDVVPGSPADKAGLKQGDVITSFAGEKVHDRSSFRLKVATSEVAKPYEIGYLRDGKEQNDLDRPGPGRQGRLRIEQGEAKREVTEKAEPAKTAISAFGLEVQPLTAELAKPLGLPAGLKGVVVSSVKEGSPAAEAGIQEGDVITKVVRNQQDPAADQRQGIPGPRLEVRRAGRLRPDRQGWAASSPCRRTRSNADRDARSPPADGGDVDRSRSTEWKGAARTKSGPPPFFMIIQIDPDPWGRSRSGCSEAGWVSWWYTEYRRRRPSKLHKKPGRGRHFPIRPHNP